MPSATGDMELPAPAPKMRELTYEIGLPGSDKAEYTYVYRFFNQYRWERVKARDKRTFTDTPTGTPSQVHRTHYLNWGYVLFQKCEISRTDLTLDAYYNFVTGAGFGVPASAYGVGRTGVVAAKLARSAPVRLARTALGVTVRGTGAAATAAAASTATTVAVGLADAAAAFIFVSYIMAWVVPASTKEWEGWMPVGGDWDEFVFKANDVQLKFETKVEKREIVTGVNNVQGRR